MTYLDALRFKPDATAEEDDMVEEFCALTGRAPELGRAALRHVLIEDAATKQNRDRAVVIPAGEQLITDDERTLLRWICHRARVPGRRRAALLDQALAIVHQHDPQSQLRSVVDFGGGGGNETIFWARNGHRAVCAEFPSSIDHWIRRRFELRGLDCTLVDVRTLSGKFDVLINLDVLEHVYDLEDVLARMLERVRDGGMLLIEPDFFNVIYNGDHLEKNRFYHNRLPAYLRRYCRRVGNGRLMAFIKVKGDDESGADIRTHLYRTTLRRARLRMAVLYPLAGVTPLEALAWTLAKPLAIGAGKQVAQRLHKDPAMVSGYVSKRANYLMIDRLADAVCCWRIARHRLNKLRQTPIAVPAGAGHLAQGEEWLVRNR